MAFRIGMISEARWYVIHTYSGYEKKVEANIKKMIDNRGLHEEIVDIQVPEKDEEEIKGQEKKIVKRKVFPGYVFIKMVMSDSSWHAVRNIRGVTGFVGPESKPVPLTEQELANMKLELRHVEIDFGVGDVMRITEGPFEGYVGKVIEIQSDKQKIKLSVDLFMGRETVVDLDVTEVAHLD